MYKKTQNYDLEEIQRHIKAGNLSINYTERSQRDATNLGYFDEDIKKCLLSLTQSDFLKQRNINMVKSQQIVMYISSIMLGLKIA